MKRGLGLFVRYLLLIGLLIVFLFPLYAATMFSLSSPPPEQAGRRLAFLVPHHMGLGRIVAETWPRLNLTRSLWNSLVVAVGRTALAVFFGTCAGYAFSKLRFPLKRFLFRVIILSIAFPTAALMLPLFHAAGRFHLYDTRLILILPFAVSGFGIYLMRRTIDDLPDDLIYAGRVDGLSELGILFRLVVPQIKPMLLALGLIEFISSWNAFDLPLVLTNQPENYTLPVLLGRLIHHAEGLARWEDVIPAALVLFLPVLILYLLFQSRILRAITIGFIRRDGAALNVRQNGSKSR